MSDFRQLTIRTGALLGAFWAISSGPGYALPNVTGLNLFRDFRAADDIGIPAGDEFQMGGNVQGGSADATIQGIFTSNAPGQSFSTHTIPCGPFATNANFCAISPGFSTARQNGTWQIKITNASGSTTVTVPSPSPIPATPVPFPTNVTISTNGQGRPTISWTAPSGTINNFRVNVFDKSQTLANGVSQQIEVATLPPTQTSYTPTSTLVAGGHYVISVQVIQTRDGQTLAANANNSDFLSRSSSYFDFSPASSSQPPVVSLPNVTPAGVYSFQVDNVGSNSVTFIDPPIAIGYVYATGNGDPNFASATLPSVGNSNYVVSFQRNGQQTASSVTANTQFFFPTGGVSTFTVTGIDPNAALDPTAPQAFVTGLTFVGAGTFTGSMTPIESGVTVFAATLPASRSVQVDATATAFATILNSGTSDAVGCSIQPAFTIPATFVYQTTNPDNSLSGTANTPVTVPAGRPQSFVVGFTWNSALPPTNVTLGFNCTNTPAVLPILGVNSLLLSASTSPVADVIAVGLTPSNDGIAHTGGSSGTGVFAIATANIGVSAPLTARVRLSNPSIPVTATVCQTNPANGQCLATRAATASATINANENDTWSVFLQATGNVALDPANNRAFLEFIDGNAVVHGSTSTAVTTQ